MQGGFSPGVVVAVSLSAVHQFSKPVQKSIRLLVGVGVEGDAHLGVTVQHRSRVAKDPTRPNLIADLEMGLATVARANQPSRTP